MFFNSSKPSHALAAIDKDLVISCCENYLSQREKRTQKDIDAWVAIFMAPDTRSFFARYILRDPAPAATREEAMLRIKKIPNEFLGFSIWQDIHWKGESTAETVKKILSMAQTTHLTYIVLSDDGQFILNYKENNE